MDLIKWNDDFSVGVEEFNGQHQKLIALINKLFTLYSENKFNNVDVDPVFKELMDYADEHLSTEEYYFTLYNYPKKDQHIAMHDAYRKKITELQLDYKKENSKETLFAINNFLNEWWVWHINNADKEYAAYFNANNLK